MVAGHDELILERRRSLVKTIAFGCAYTVVMLALGVAIGNWAIDHHLKSRIVARIEGTFVGRLLASTHEAPFPDIQHLNWNASPPLISNLHYLQAVKVKLAPFETYGEGGAIQEVSGNILYASPLGQLGYLSRKHVIHAIHARVPMKLDALRAHPISKDPRFVMSYFRTLDLLVVAKTPTVFDLYVSHHRFNSDGCFEFVVSRAEGHVQDDSVDIADSWKEVFVARPCMQPKEVDLFFAGLESGGRLALLDARTLLVTIGDHQFDGVRSKTAAAQDPDSNLGKVMAIDLASGRARVISSGHRNPQGLLVARDGTIWETEHGPQGGDEINIIREGLNYGWPLVTYGREYGYRPRNWPLNPEQGRHDGYELPAFVFVPSIAISNLIQPDPREWPLWRDHLLVASYGGLKRTGGGKLYAVRVERDKRIVYAEEIVVPVEDGEKLRDIISLADGRFAVLTDHAALLFFRNETGPATAVSARESEFDVTLGADAKTAIATAVPIMPPSPVGTGRQLFASKCASCHTLNGQIKVGPPLNHLFGRRIGSFDGFSYSRGMKNAGGEWSFGQLIEFLQILDQPYEGSPMPRPQLSYESAKDIASYLDKQ